MYFFIFISGLVIGSFLNVCIYRIPKGESIAWPGSHCPKCQQPLAWYELLPVVSFLLLRGRCSTCRQSISFRYPLVELCTGLIFIYLYQRYDLSMNFLTSAFLACLLIVISFIDIDHRIIPNRLVLLGLVGGILLNVFSHNLTWIPLLLGFMAGGGALLAIALLFPGGMGGGDIKLAAMLGVYVGWPDILGVLFIASFLGGIIGLGLVITKLKSRKDPIPFGPFLAAGAMVILLKGTQLWDAYINYIYR